METKGTDNLCVKILETIIRDLREELKVKKDYEREVENLKKRVNSLEADSYRYATQLENTIDELEEELDEVEELLYETERENDYLVEDVYELKEEVQYLESKNKELLQDSYELMEQLDFYMKNVPPYGL